MLCLNDSGAKVADGQRGGSQRAGNSKPLKPARHCERSEAIYQRFHSRIIPNLASLRAQ